MRYSLGIKRTTKKPDTDFTNFGNINIVTQVLFCMDKDVDIDKISNNINVIRNQGFQYERDTDIKAKDLSKTL